MSWSKSSWSTNFSSKKYSNVIARRRIENRVKKIILLARLRRVKGASSRCKTAFTPHQSLSRRIFAWLCSLPMLAVQHPPLSFENLFPSYLNAALPHRSSTPSQAECSRRASINFYLVQRQTEWNWSIPSRVGHERKGGKGERGGSVQSAFSFRLSSDDLQDFSLEKRFIFIARSLLLDIKRRMKTRFGWWSIQQEEFSQQSLRSNFSLKNGDGGCLSGEISKDILGRI